MGNQQGSLNRNDWMEVPEMEGYYVDRDGRVFSRRRGGLRPLTPSEHLARGRKRYMRIKINGATALVHRVVASAKIGRPLRKGEVVNHLNGDTKDNSPSNLEVVSHRENVAHAVQNGLYCSGDEWYRARGMSKD